MMEVKLPGRHENEYYIIVAHIFPMTSLKIQFNIDSWERHTTGPLSECKWNTDDGNGHHRSTMCCRFYRDGQMEWFLDDGQERPGLPLSVVNGIEELCNRIIKLKAFL
jgi:hypothetical protein